MNPWDIHEVVAFERRHDEIRAAAYSRLVRQAEEGRESQPLWFVGSSFSLRPMALVLARLLSFIGGNMVSWSCRLQYRYAVISGAADNQPCQ